MKALARLCFILSFFTVLPVGIICWVITGKNIVFPVWDYLETKAGIR